MSFELENSQRLELPTRSTDIKVFKLKDRDFRIICVDVPGPLVSCSIVIPTVSDSHKGLPHTLEHLIFCGSKSYPTRGYLDNLAVRCLSTGTNAYTAEDHTCYEITTVGMDGMLNILPVFLDHVLNPTLKDCSFITEVYHLDGEAHHQGVVYCEMASRENTEADLMDLNLRQLLYPDKSNYSFECGGQTSFIQQLRNEEVIRYHQQFYHVDNATVIICGSSNAQVLFDHLARFPDLFEAKDSFIPLPKSVHLDPNFIGRSKKTRMVPFPSDDLDVGSIGYAWNGPPSEDAKTLIALEVLFRYLNDNPSSLLAQAFVERANPLASDIDLDTKSYVESPIVWIFSGVPRQQQPTMSDDDDNSTSESSRSAAGFEMEDLFAPGIFYSKVLACIKDFITRGPSGGMINTIRRHARKMKESLEESPHESIAMNLVPDIVRYFLADFSALGDTRKQNGIPKIGVRLQIFSILKELEKENDSFWTALAQKWLLDARVVEVLMVPDAELAHKMTEQEIEERKQRKLELNDEKLQSLKEKVDLAVAENKVILSKEIVASMPRIPDVSKALSIPSYMENVGIADTSQFSMCQVVKTDTAFAHLGLAINIAGLPESCRKYLVLFQELMFQSPLELPATEGNTVKMTYQDVSIYSSELFVSHECGVGFGNSIFSASYLSQLITIFVTAGLDDFERMIRFTAQVLMFSVFTKERVSCVAKNLLSTLIDVKRDGNSILGAIAGRVALSPSFSKRTGNCENDISIFEQEVTLKNVLNMLKNDNSSEVFDALNLIKNHIVSNRDESSSFLRIAVPVRFSVNRQSHPSSSKEICSSFLTVWTEEFAKYKTLQFNELNGNKRKSRSLIEKQSVFPYPRIPFSYDQVDKKFGNSIMVPVAGLSTSYLCQFVPCDLLTDCKNPDYFPTVVLAEILGRAEGPLYEGVRGQGLAYGVNLTSYLWTGQLAFDLYRSSEPMKALQVFYDLLKELQTAESFEKYCSSYEIETAKASIAYRWASNGSTASSLISTALRISLQGFASMEEYANFVQQLSHVTAVDLNRVFKTYFLQFLDTKPVTILTSVTDQKGEEIKKSFAPLIKFKSYEFTDFALPHHH